jgi:hypothetical protein
MIIYEHTEEIKFFDLKTDFFRINVILTELPSVYELLEFIFKNIRFQNVLFVSIFIYRLPGCIGYPACQCGLHRNFAAAGHLII